jgi:phosphoribosylformylglycinamidine cyclo-ligase
VFDWLQREGAVADGEMWRTFNCGIGFVLMVSPEQVSAVESDLARLGQPHWRIGAVVKAGDAERLKIG